MGPRERRVTPKSTLQVRDRARVISPRGTHLPEENVTVQRRDVRVVRIEVHRLAVFRFRVLQAALPLVLLPRAHVVRRGLRGLRPSLCRQEERHADEQKAAAHRWIIAAELPAARSVALESA